ncbi:hypothetical protein FOA52_006919 [Chlamydomonas sp. UWO 241]|nr:hypothetical protein FOA52_006919 [Chlamydomonas sp. UWO 241]
MGDTFRHIWLERDWAKTKDGKVWLEEVKGDPFHAFCNLCSKYMNAMSSTVTGHSKKGTKHQSRDVRSIEVAAAAAQPPEAVQQHFAHDAWSNEGKRTLLQMRVLLNLMQHGRPMTAYEQEKAVFKGLVDAKVINQDYMSSANWSDDAGWELVSYMARHVAKLELARVRGAAFFAVSGDEATSRDKLSYFSLTAYIMVNWERVPAVLDVPRIDDAPNAETLTEMLIKAIGLAGIDADAMRERLMSVAFDGASVMQGEFSGVATRVRTEPPFTLAMWFVTHRMALSAKASAGLVMLDGVERLAQLTYAYMSQSAVRTRHMAEASAKAGYATTSLLRGIATRWLSTLRPLERLVEKYAVVVRFFHDESESDITAQAQADGILSQLLSLDTLLYMHMALPLLRTLQQFVKASQLRGVTAVELAEDIERTLKVLAELFIDPGSKFKDESFHSLNTLITDEPDGLVQWRDVDDGRELQLRDSAGTFHTLTARPIATGQRGRPRGLQPITTEQELADYLSRAEGYTVEAAQVVSADIKQRFPPSDHLDALSLVHHSMWQSYNRELFGAADDDARRRTVEANFKAAFSRRVALVEEHFGTSKTREVRKEDGEVEVHIVPARIDMKQLRAESAQFYSLAMQHSNSREWAESKASGVTTMWRLIDKKSDGSSGRAHQLFPTWARLAEMSIVLAPTSVEDERKFSGLNYIKNECSRLGSGNSHDHLVWAMRMFISRLFTLDTFPYAAVIKEWREKRCVI